MNKLAPSALVGSVLCFAAAAVAPAVLLAPTPAEAAPSRFVQVWDKPRATSIGVYAVDTRLRCVSVVTGRAPAVVSVSIGRTSVLRGVRVPPRTETGCIALPRAVTVPTNTWIYTRAHSTAPVRRTKLP